MVVCPLRSDFTSEPDSTMPASNVSRISYECRALRFSATILPGGCFFGAAMVCLCWSGIG
jgi:hypothetical protein